MSSKKITILILFVFLSTRLIGLGPDISNTDAYRWHTRSQNFLAALKKGDLKDTYQHYQPGVTLMWINAVVKQVSFSTQYHILGNKKPKTLENADYFPVIHGASKVVLVFVLAALLLLQIFLIRKIFDEKTSLLYGFFIAIEPYIIGLDRWFHLTSLETYFAFASFLFLLWWYKIPEKRKLALAGIFFALSVLSKITTLATAPMYLLVLMFKFYENGEKNYKKLAGNVFYIAVFSIITILIIFPALSSHPYFVMQKILDAGRNAVSNTNQQYILNPLVRTFFYDLISILKFSPITLILFVGAFIKYKQVLNKKPAVFTVLYVFLYYLVLTISQKKIDRYVMAMMPGMILLGSLLVRTFEPKITKLLLTSSFIYLLITIIIYHPVYSAYYSPLFGGTRTALKLKIYDNSGEYFAQAARYLNRKGRDAKVFVPDGEASFNYYFEGKRVYSMDEDPDFIVVSLDSDRGVKDYGCEKEASFGSREMDIVHIFECTN